MTRKSCRGATRDKAVMLIAAAIGLLFFRSTSWITRRFALTSARRDDLNDSLR